MRCSHSISKSRAKAAMLTGFLMLGIGHGWAQAAQPREVSTGDPFRSIHDSLSSAAERALAGPLQRSPEASRNDSLFSVATKAAPAKTGSPLRAMNRVQQLRPIVEPILREERVPTELAAVALVESGGRPNALSPKGALGAWQFMPETARRYGLIVTPEHDERLDVQRSTRAAARYLRDLYGQFGDWQLAFAAYNAGEKLVRRAIDQNRTNDFSRLSSRGALPLETRRYVPAVINAMRKAEHANGHVAPPRDASATWILYAENQLATDRPDFLKELKEVPK